MTQTLPSGPLYVYPTAPVRPHRGTMILVLGLLSLACLAMCGCCCFVPSLALGLAAWLMGSRDLRLMTAGGMDRSGESLTQAGKILGIVGVVVSLLIMLALLIYALFWAAIMLVATVAGASH